MAARAQDNFSWPRKILMTTDAVGGIWQYSLDLISELAKHGTEVLLATLGPRPSARQCEQATTISRMILRESDFALEWMSNPWHDVNCSGEWLRELQKHFQADVIHLNSFSLAALAWDAPTLVVAHSCVYSWWRAVHDCAPSELWCEYKARVSRGLHACAAVVAPSSYMANALAAEYGTPLDKISVIHNFTNAQSRCTEKQPFILAAGRLWDPAKNLALLSAIAPSLAWEVRVAGSGRGPENSQSVACSGVLQLGPLPHSQLLREMSHASIFLHPTFYEPFGLCVLEAAKAGCCLVLSDISSLRELWHDAALFVDPQKPEEWIFEIDKIIRDSVQREALAAAAELRAKDYDTNDSVQKYMSLYRCLYDQRQQRQGAAA